VHFGDGKRNIRGKLGTTYSGEGNVCRITRSKQSKERIDWEGARGSKKKTGIPII